MDKDQIIRIFEASPCPVIVVKADYPHFPIINVNKAYQSLAGKSKNELLDINIFETFHKNKSAENEEAERLLMSAFVQVMETKEELKHHFFRYDVKDEERYWRPCISPIAAESGEVELLMLTVLDVTEEIKHLNQIDLMLNHSEDSFMLIDCEFKILGFNDKFFQTHRTIFGFEVKKGHSIFEYVDAKYKQSIIKKYQQVLSGETLRMELLLSDQEGKKRVFDMIYKPVKDYKGTIYALYVSRQEITEKYAIKQQIEVNEARFRALVETGNDVVIILSAEGSPTYISPSIKNVLGFEPEDIGNLGISELVHTDDQPLVLAELQKSLEKPGVPITVPPARMKHKDGSWRWFDGTITNMLHDPAIQGIVDNFKEITEQIETKKKLIETKELHQSLLNSIEGVVWEAEADTLEFNFVSNQSLELFGYPPKLFIESPDFWKDNIHPDDRDRTVNYCINQTAVGKNHEMEYRFKIANGEYIWLKDVVRVIQENGTPTVLRGLLLNISEQKELQKQLDETYEMAKIGTWEINYETEKINWSTFIKRVHEVPLDFVPTFENAIPFYKVGESRDLIQHAMKDAITNGVSFDVELAIVTAKGNNKWIRVVGNPEIKNGKCIRIFGNTQDVTERVAARKKLETTEEKYRNVVEHSTNMFYTHDTNGVLTYVSPQSEYFLGYEPEEAKKRWTEFITDHPINKIGIEFTQKAIDTGKRQPPYELQLITAKNQIIWVEVNEAPLVKDGKTTAIIGSLSDITKRKRYQDQLQESLDRYNYVSKASRDAIYDWDIIQNKTHWASGFYTLFGHDRTDLNHQVNGWEALLHPDDLNEATSKLEQALKDPTKKILTYEYRFRKQDGTYAYVNENGYIIRDNDGNAIRMIGTMQDVTEQVLTKNEIQASLTEKETLLAEIHHRVKNNLAVVSGMMQLQAFETEDEDLQAKLFDSVVRIKTMASVHELLYQSRSFSKLEFSQTLSLLVENISNTLQTNAAVEVEIDCENLHLNINQAIPASLIVNEVLTNAYKHAFKEKKAGHIYFQLSENDDHIHIQIADDGVGLPNSEAYRKGSLGFQLIEVLCQQIHATYTYQNAEQGTVFNMEFQRLANARGIGNASLV